MPLGLLDNKGKMKKGVPMLLAILGITGALSIWGIKEVYAQQQATNKELKDKVTALQNSDTEIIKDIGDKVGSIQTTLATTGISPESVTAIVNTMKDSQQEVFKAQLESQSVLLDSKIEKANAPVIKTQQELQQSVTAVLQRFDGQQQTQQRQQEQLATAVSNFENYTKNQEQINIRNAQQNGALSQKLEENKATADQILQLLGDLQKQLKKPEPVEPETDNEQ